MKRQHSKFCPCQRGNCNSKGQVSLVLKCGHIGSNSNALCKVKPVSCFDDISMSTEIAQCEKGLGTNKTIGVEISGTSQTVGKDSNLHIAELSAPAGTLALKYVDAEVPQNCNKQEVREIFPTCTD